MIQFFRISFLIITFFYALGLRAQDQHLSAQDVDTVSENPADIKNKGRFTKFPDTRFQIDVGGYVAFLSSSVQLGLKALGGGIIIDAEKAFGLESNQSVFFADFGVSLGKNLKHHLEAGFMFSRRSAFKIITEDIYIDDIFIPAETKVETTFNFDVYRLEYLYSIVKERRTEVQLGAGFFIMPLQFETVIKTPGLNFNLPARADITAPLPVVELQLEIALSPRLILNQELALMYLKIGDFEGDITSFQLNLRYLIAKNIGIGAGWNKFDLNVVANGYAWPGVDFVGQIGFGYSGPFLYGTVSF